MDTRASSTVRRCCQSAWRPRQLRSLTKSKWLILPSSLMIYREVTDSHFVLYYGSGRNNLSVIRGIILHTPDPSSVCTEQESLWRHWGHIDDDLYFPLMSNLMFFLCQAEATPKSLMRMIGVPGLTLYHLKSHLQKYRLGKNQQSETCSDSNQVGAAYKDDLNELNLLSQGNEVNNNDSTQEQIKENVRVAQALHIQMEVQRKLHEQIEVQRHLQLRIEAQGKYLQKVLKKAQETLSGYSFSSAGVQVENAKAEISQLVSMVNGSSFSKLSEITYVSLENQHRKGTMSIESSLTSSESSGRRKRSRSSIPFEGICDEETDNKISIQEHREETEDGFRKLGLLETFDLNRQCENDFDLGEKLPIDLNSKGAEQIESASLGA